MLALAGMALIIPAFYEGETKLARGRIVKIYEGGVCDMVVCLETSEQFYLNRAFQHYDRKVLNDLNGKEVVITYSEKPRFFPARMINIDTLEANGQIFVER